MVQLKSEFYHVQQGGFSRGSGLQAGNAAVDAVWLDCVDTENMRYQYVGGEARDDQIQQLHLDMFVGIPSLRPWAHTDNRGLAGGGVLFSMSDQCHREITCSVSNYTIASISITSNITTSNTTTKPTRVTWLVVGVARFFSTNVNFNFVGRY